MPRGRFYFYLLNIFSLRNSGSRTKVDGFVCNLCTLGFDMHLLKVILWFPHLPMFVLSVSFGRVIKRELLVVGRAVERVNIFFSAKRNTQNIGYVFVNLCLLIIYFVPTLTSSYKCLSIY